MQPTKVILLCLHVCFSLQQHILPEHLQKVCDAVRTEELLERTMPRMRQLIRRTLEETSADIAALKQDNAILKQDVTALRLDNVALKQDNVDLKQDVTALKYDVTALKQALADLSMTDVSSSVTTEMTTVVQTPTTASLDSENSTGTEFVMMFLPEVSTYPTYPNQPQVYLTTSQPGAYTYTVVGPDFTDNGQLSVGMNTLDISTSVITNKNVIETKAVHISTSVRTSVFLMNYEGYQYSDMSLVFPKEYCRTNYIVPAFKPFDMTGHYSMIGIASLASDTTVQFILTMTSGSITYGGQTYTDGDILILSLQRLQTFTLALNRGDLSGTRITSSKPVCVMAGTTCAVVGSYGICGRLDEMIPPVEQFSTTSVIPFINKTADVIIRVMSSSQPADLNYTIGINTHESRSVGLLQYTYTDIEVAVQEPVALVATSPVLVTMYVKSSGSPPFMILVPGVDQYLSTYHFAVPPHTGFTHHVSIVIPSDQASGLRLDGGLFSSIRKSTVTNTGTPYTVLSASVDAGGHVMNHVHDISFGLFVYGGDIYDGYGYVAGIQFRKDL